MNPLGTALDAFASGDLSAAAACFSDDATYREVRRAPLRGRAAIAEHFSAFHAQRREWRFTLEDVVREDERACVVYRFASAEGEGQPWRERDGCATIRLDQGGLIAEWREYEG